MPGLNLFNAYTFEVEFQFPINYIAVLPYLLICWEEGLGITFGWLFFSVGIQIERFV